VPAQQVARFTRLWARKEAFVKVAGGRLQPGLEQVIPPSGVVVDGVGGGPPGGSCLVRDVPAPRGYRAAVAAEGTHAYDVIRRWAVLLRGREIYMAMLICIADIRLVRAITEEIRVPSASGAAASIWLPSAALTTP
jgi:hypothetical protein